MQGFESAVSGLDAHPKLSQFVVGCRSGLIQLWDYDTRKILRSKRFPNSAIQTVKLDGEGANLAVGMQSE